MNFMDHILIFAVFGIGAESFSVNENACRFSEMCNWVQVSYNGLFSLFILRTTSLYCAPSPSPLLSPSVTLCLPLFVFVNKLCKQLNLSSGTKTAENWAKRFIATILSFVITGPCVLNRLLFCYSNLFQIKKERGRKKDTKWRTSAPADKECWKSGWIFWWKGSMLCFIRLLATSLVGWLLLLV